MEVLVKVSLSVIVIIVFYLFLMFLIRSGDSTDKNSCSDENCNGSSNWKQKDGSCKCHCSKNTTGSNCMECKKGYYSSYEFSVSGGNDLIKCNKCSSCDISKGEYKVADCEGEQDTVCYNCPTGSFINSDGICKQCKNCDVDTTSCDSENCRLDTECHYDSKSNAWVDSTCTDFICDADTQYYDIKESTCVTRESPDENKVIISTGTKTSPVIYSDVCPSGTYKYTLTDAEKPNWIPSGSQLCKPCKICDDEHINKGGICTGETETDVVVCSKCEDTYYSLLDKSRCIKSPCNDGQYLDTDCVRKNINSNTLENCCKKCNKCTTDPYNIYEKECTTTSNSICNTQCLDNDYYIDQNNICKSCTKCNSNQYTYKECTNDSDSICLSGLVPYPLSLKVCPSCFPEISNLDEIKQKYSLQQLCESEKNCSDSSDCINQQGEFTWNGACVDKKCVVYDSQENSCTSEDVLNCTDREGLSGKCSDVDSAKVWKILQPVEGEGEYLVVDSSPMKGYSLGDEYGRYSSKIPRPDSDEFVVIDQNINYGDSCYIPTSGDANQKPQCVFNVSELQNKIASCNGSCESNDLACNKDLCELATDGFINCSSDITTPKSCMFDVDETQLTFSDADGFMVNTVICNSGIATGKSYVQDKYGLLTPTPVVDGMSCVKSAS